MSWYIHNRPLLTERADLSAAEIDACAIPTGFVVQAAADGEPTAQLDGKMVHSRRDPRAEARRLIRSSCADGTVVLFYGVGLGYHAEEFLAHCSQGIAVIIEPEPAMLRAALEARDARPLLSEGRLHFLVGQHPDALAVILRRYEHHRCSTIRLRSVYERNRDYYRSLDAVQEQFAGRREINTNTLRRFAGVWIRNLSRNVPLLTGAAGVESAAGRFEGIPALLLAAGPSLDQVLPYIEQLRQRALVISVDTAAAALAAVAVEPDILVVVDPQWWNTRHLDRLSLDGTIVVSESSTHPRVFRLLQGKTLFAASLFPLGRYLEQSTRISGTLGAGGSVATSAWDLARLLGCRPVYCAGLDLGFPRNRTHCRGSFFEERAHTLSERTRPAAHHDFAYLVEADPYPVEANSGSQVLTDRRMAIYHWWFANQARIHRDCDSRNLSPDGVRIEGFAYAEVDELLSRPDRRSDIDRELERLRVDGGAAARGATADQTLSARLQLLTEELQRVGSLCRTGISAIERTRCGLQTVTAALAQLDQVDRLLRSSQNRDIAGFMVQDVLADVMRGDTAANGPRAATTRAPSAPPLEVASAATPPTSADPLQSSERIYAALLRSADFHVRELQQALRRLSALPGRDVESS
ncbi:MAG: DUF115 domain-containing protein [Spirochaetaceae bacterium]|nr:MAG: DUF115 domain-containing protein [Spirochaetaceae bacterium]